MIRARSTGSTGLGKGRYADLYPNWAFILHKTDVNLTRTVLSVILCSLSLLQSSQSFRWLTPYVVLRIVEPSYALVELAYIVISVDNTWRQVPILMTATNYEDNTSN